jgi:hypothetical protein
MTEADWLACMDPQPMLAHLHGGVADRKLRLYYCAWARLLWRRLGDERSREAVATAERFADGLSALPELLLAFNVAQQAWKEIRTDRGGRRGERPKCSEGSRQAKEAAAVARNAANPFLNARTAGLYAWRENGARRVALSGALRDLIGNPFRPPRLDPAWLRWNDGVVVKMAQAIYDESRFGDLPILADALEESGCEAKDVLNHCRKPAEHVKGCWLVDLLLGKE